MPVSDNFIGIIDQYFIKIFRCGKTLEGAVRKYNLRYK